jgi:hypothetical protein
VAELSAQSANDNSPNAVSRERGPAVHRDADDTLTDRLAAERCGFVNLKAKTLRRDAGANIILRKRVRTIYDELGVGIPPAAIRTRG